jgi:hypothetical protein
MAFVAERVAKSVEKWLPRQGRSLPASPHEGCTYTIEFEIVPKGGALSLSDGSYIHMHMLLQSLLPVKFAILSSERGRGVIGTTSDKEPSDPELVLFQVKKSFRKRVENAFDIAFSSPKRKE